VRFFNTAGPVECARHYCLPPLERLDLAEMLVLIGQQKYFVLHAPRQTGKTTCLLALRDHLNREGRYRALYVNFEVAQGYRERINEGLTALLQEIAGQARLTLGDATADVIARDLITLGAPSLSVFLSRWCDAADLPTVLLIDEIDALVGDLLITVLRQLRAGYPNRPGAFPQSVILCGVRDVRDYRIHSGQSQTIITGGSAFNIKAASLRLGDFTHREILALYAQHTAETGQLFEPAALEAIWELTAGQPWLVNAVGYETCFAMAPGRERSRPITAEMVFEAKEALILRRETHLDQLADKLREPRVRGVIQALLVGGDAPETLLEDDLQYVADLGLIQRKPSVTIANPIYREIIPRTLTSTTQDMLTQDTAWYIRPDGRLDVTRLLAAFQQFFREHSESWVERFDYKEAGPQLLLQAFLQRIVNGGGRVEREYGLGRGRTDLLVIWPVWNESANRRISESTNDAVRNTQYAIRLTQRIVIELKVLHKSLDATLAQGLAQTWAYADRCGAAEAHLVIFDRTPAKPWDAKIFRRDEVYRGTPDRAVEFPITVWGM
jgi:hypothetical protein